jgi:NADPH-dependent 2,4-dienoyl-CoA reductase/sulfur reductase-like enzyme
MTRLLIIGGVAGGATAAARARRLDEQAEITVIDRGPYVSYANCGLPYFIGGKIADRSQLLLQTPEGFWARYRVTVHVETEAVEIDRAAHRVRVLGPAGERWLPYDKLLLAQGGNPILPPIPGADAANVFTMWTIPDTDRLQAYLDSAKPKTAVVVGGGFIGLEMAEAFQRRGLATTIVELLPTVMGIMDRAFGVAIARELEANGIEVDTGVGVRAVHAGERTVELANGRRLPADVVLFSVGVRPELALAKAAGLAIGASGALEVDEHLRTSDPDVYAAGDMAEILHKVTGRRVRVPLAGPANRQGRIAASNALGHTMIYRGALGTSVVKVFESTAASTGLTEKAARDAGFDVGVAVVHKVHHAGYYPGAQELTLTLVYDRKTARLLGGQAFGRAGADKRIDVLATALQGKLTLHDLAAAEGRAGVRSAADRARCAKCGGARRVPSARVAPPHAGGASTGARYFLRRDADGVVVRGTEARFQATYDIFDPRPIGEPRRIDIHLDVGSQTVTFELAAFRCPERLRLVGQGGASELAPDTADGGRPAQRLGWLHEILGDVLAADGSRLHRAVPRVWRKRRDRELPCSRCLRGGACAFGLRGDRRRLRGGESVVPSRVRAGQQQSVALPAPGGMLCADMPACAPVAEPTVLCQGASM